MPASPGIYRFWGRNKEILYVGKARNLKKRVSSYFLKGNKGPRIAKLIEKIDDISVTVTSSEVEALLLEINLIKSLKPRFNVVFRDDKTYPYIVFSDHKYPRIMTYRGKMPPSTESHFGPYTDAGSVRKSIQILQKIFRLRTCDDYVFGNRKRPCLLYQIGHCSAPCVGKVSESSYREDVVRARLFLSGKRSYIMSALDEEMQLCSDKLLFERAAQIRDQIIALQKMIEVQHVVSDNHDNLDIIDGLFSNDYSLFVINVMNVRDGHIIDHKDYVLQNENFIDCDVSELIIRFVIEHYGVVSPPEFVILPSVVSLELVSNALNKCGLTCRAIAPDKVHIGLVSLVKDNLSNSIDRCLFHRDVRLSRWRAVCKLMNIYEDCARVECFDISHIHGSNTVGVCVVWQGNGFLRSEFRRYDVKGVTPGDDPASMYQVVNKHYSNVLRRSGIQPDMIIIDGGVEQLKAACRAISELQLSIPIVALSKGRSRKVGQETLYFSDGREPLKMSVSDESLLFLAEVRDESHRYAVSSHRSRRIKKNFNSVLDGIKGVGPKRRQLLLNRFGSVRAMADLNPDTLATVSGISFELALRIYESLKTIR
ncbi:excinuclease ABC subunit UvrC [Candidatus Ichthyocystis sparus]|uniref:excinuclease ABC subunit UvrC n=1 Tax=Candidatus Ichthyocystis sparus TaxID=1561004 RepID=UPI00159EC483|nr:excinuclease ABC subunit UvrC [Candidatus Ichthyocystis sparus]